jgi:hypothetical protein
MFDERLSATVGSFKIELSDGLKRFAIGGGVNRQMGRVISANNSMWIPSPRNPNGVLPPANGTPGSLPWLAIKSSTMTQLWMSFVPNKRWSFRLSCNNVLDERFPVSLQHTSTIDPAQPRTFQSVSTFRF